MSSRSCLFNRTVQDRGEDSRDRPRNLLTPDAKGRPRPAATRLQPQSSGVPLVGFPYNVLSMRWRECCHQIYILARPGYYKSPDRRD